LDNVGHADGDAQRTFINYARILGVLPSAVLQVPVGNSLAKLAVPDTLAARQAEHVSLVHHCSTLQLHPEYRDIPTEVIDNVLGTVLTLLEAVILGS